MSINAKPRRLTRPYQGIVSWKGTVLHHSLKLWSGRGTCSESEVWHCYIFPAGVGNRVGWVQLRISWCLKGYCHFLLPEWDKLRVQISLPFLW